MQKQASIVDVCAYSEISHIKLLCFNLAEVSEVKGWLRKIGPVHVVAKVHAVL